MATNLEARTGKSVAAWVAIVNDAAVEGFNDTISWLKEHHQMGHFQARLIAEACRDHDE